jgi:hypothetical protein
MWYQQNVGTHIAGVPRTYVVRILAYLQHVSTRIIAPCCYQFTNDYSQHVQRSLKTKAVNQLTFFGCSVNYVSFAAARPGLSQNREKQKVDFLVFPMILA